MFVCPGCGQVHDVGENGLTPFAAWTAQATTELAVAGSIRYLAVWRLLPNTAGGDDPVWEHIRRLAAPNPAYLYVPAFSMARAVVQRIGVRLTETQPVLELSPGGPVGPGPRPVLVEAAALVSPFPGAPTGPLTAVPTPAPDGAFAAVGVSTPEAGSFTDAPDFEGVSPVLIGRREAWGLAHFVYMAIEARETRDVQVADPRLEPGDEELLFLPAVWDPRYIHESNWRLLLREFDGLVA